MNRSHRAPITEGSVAGVFEDLVPAEGSSVPRASRPPSSKAAREMREVRDVHAVVPTSQMIDTQPHEFRPEPIDGLGPSPASQREALALLAAPSSSTMRLPHEANPAAAFSGPSPSLAPPPSPPAPASSPMPSSVPAAEPRTSRVALPVAVAAALIAAIVASVATAGVARACHRGALGGTVCSAVR